MLLKYTTLLIIFNLLLTQFHILSINKAIVIGASTGIGKEIAKELAGQNYILGLASRNINLLTQLQKEIETETFVKEIDISKQEEAMLKLQELINQMGGMDLIVINAGVAFVEEELSRESINETIEVNVKGFCAIALVAAKYFEQQKSGHIVGISSIAALRGQPFQPTYSASKAFVSTYLESLRNRFIQLNIPIHVTDVKPGYVDTPLVQKHIKDYREKYNSNPNVFWMASAKEAAKQIVDAISSHKKHVYITKRWVIFAWLLQFLPDFLYNRYFA